VSLTSTEENYLKAIFKIEEREEGPAGTNHIAEEMSTSAASASDMIRKLSEKELLNYEKYRGVHLSPEGRRIATLLIRKHRLWESFLVEKLNFNWDEIHEIAEELEHIRSTKLIRQLDAFLGHPKYDPHGDPIPNAEGIFHKRQQIQLSKMQQEAQGVIVGVNEHSTSFLQFLDQQGLVLGTRIRMLQLYDFDESVEVEVNEKEKRTLSKKVSENIYVQVE
jgi:DtxR family Mn-dependent transcriptional regulator